MSEKNLGYLAVYDVRGIQEFVFRTNKLKENSGASTIVANIFTNALYNAINEIKWKKEEYRIEWDTYPEFRFLTDEKIKMELLYTGAGNTYIAYRRQQDCQKMNRFISKYVLENSYSLNLAIAVVPMKEDYEETYRELSEKLTENKAKMPMTRLVGNLSITRQDTNTGYPFSDYRKIENDWQALSKESALKLQAFESDGEKELDKMGTEKGSDSQIAIVHIDGNNMGKLVASQMKNLHEYSVAVKKIRELSKSISQDFMSALEYTENALVDFVKSDKCVFKDKWNEKTEEYRKYMRKVISSGDDITFICNARVAISLCEIFLKKLKAGTNKFSACAGIAIINSHFPFYAGYAMAEQCCGEAKKRAKKYAEDPNQVGNYIDFQICKNIMMASDLEGSREKNYRLSDGSYLLTRPYCVDESFPKDKPKRQHIDCFKNDYSFFAEETYPNNVVKGLRNAYSVSRYEADLFYRKMKSRKNNLPEGCDELFIGNEALFFDVLEMYELYIDVEGGVTNEKNNGN